MIYRLYPRDQTTRARERFFIKIKNSLQSHHITLMSNKIGVVLAYGKRITKDARPVGGRVRDAFTIYAVTLAFVLRLANDIRVFLFNSNANFGEMQSVSF